MTGLVISVGLFLLVAMAWWRRGRRPHAASGGWTRSGHGTVGPGAAGAFYEMLNDDRRKALEIIVEQKAAATDPEEQEDNRNPLRPSRFELRS